MFMTPSGVIQPQKAYECSGYLAVFIYPQQEAFEQEALHADGEKRNNTCKACGGQALYPQPEALSLIPRSTREPAIKSKALLLYVLKMSAHSKPLDYLRASGPPFAQGLEGLVDTVHFAK